VEQRRVGKVAAAPANDCDDPAKPNSEAVEARQRRSVGRRSLPREITEHGPGALPGVAARRASRRPPELAAAPPKPLRRRRKPPFWEPDRPYVEEARKRHMQRPVSPGVRLEPGPKGYRLESPHRDLEAWDVQIANAFGTRSHSTFSVFLEQLTELCPLVRDAKGDLVPCELHLNAALNIVNGVRPRNEMEAALAAQMVAVHFMTMKVSGEALHHGWTDARNAAIAGKLARTFAQQMDTLARQRGRVGKQTIKVRIERHEHRHVHIGEGGLEKGTQAQAPARRIDRLAAVEPEPGATVQRQDETRDRVPRPRRKG